MASQPSSEATPTAEPAGAAAPRRECGDCGLCCRLLAVDEIGKPAGVWCGHFVPGTGCGIYDARPAACRTFRCLWLDQSELGPEWQPNRSHIVLYLAAKDGQLIANVDPRHPRVWRQAPFRDRLQDWARRGLEEGFQVVVKVGRRMIALLPDREVDLGELAEGERIRFSRVHTDHGVGLVARKVGAEEPPA